MANLKILYVSRNHSRSGYSILKSLIDNGLPPAAVLLPEPIMQIKSMKRLFVQKGLYRAQSLIENSNPLKFFESEFLLAKKANIPILHSSPTSFDNAILEKIRKSRYDLIFLGGGWPSLLPKDFTGLGRLGTFNTHPSLLPNFRGTSVTRWQVLEGVSESGVTIHLVNEHFDAGPIIAQANLLVEPDETPQALFQRLSDLGANLATQVIANLQDFENVPSLVPQRYLGRYYPKWDWNLENLKIDFSKPNKFIHQFVLANTQESYKFVGPSLRLNDKDFYIRETGVIMAASLEENAKLFENTKQAIVSRDGFIVISKLGDPNILLLKKIQPIGKTLGLTRASIPGKFFAIDERIRVNG